MYKLGLITVLLITLFGCGGGSSSGSRSSGGGEEPNSTAFGIFEDSAVEGLEYSSGEISGVTTAQGEFEYRVGMPITFSIGDIIFGSVDGNEVVTPVDLIASAEDETNPAVANIARFLQTLDDDNNADNGIVIVAAVRDLAIGRTINFDQSVAEFGDDGNVQIVVAELTALTSAGARSLVSQTQAQEHLRGTLLANLAGSYEGTFSGDDSGTWMFVANEEGAITGSGRSNDSGEFLFAGNIQSSGDAAFGGTSTGAVFNAEIAADGTVTGTWQSLMFDEDGTLTGSIEESN